MVMYVIADLRRKTWTWAGGEPTQEHIAELSGLMRRPIREVNPALEKKVAVAVKKSAAGGTLDGFLVTHEALFYDDWYAPLQKALGMKPDKSGGMAYGGGPFYKLPKTWRYSSEKMPLGRWVEHMGF